MNAALAVGLTWPVAWHWRTRIPIGVEPAGTVPFFNLWTLRWNAHAFSGFGANLGDYWNSPIFHPVHDTFARSEAQPLSGFVFWLLRTVVGDVGAYNALIVAFVALNGVAGYALARRLRVGVVPALAVGAIAQGLPFVWDQFGVFQLVCVFPMIFAVERLLAYRESPRWTRALALGAVCAATELMSGYYAVFLAFTLVVMAPIVAWRAPGLGVRRAAGHAGVVAATIGVLAGPFALAQQSRTAGIAWTTTTVSNLSARPGQWIERGPTTLALPWSRPSTLGDPLFVGGVVIALALVGLLVALRTRSGRRATAASLLAGAIAAVMSGGFRWKFGTWRPYSFLYDHGPGFDRLRSPFRFAVSAQMSLLVPVAIAIGWLWTHRVHVARVAVVVLAVLSLAETTQLGAATVRVPDTATTDWVRWLRAHPGGAVAMVPFAPGPGEADFEDTTIGMLAALDHEHPLVNGYTGFFPPSGSDLLDAMKVFPDSYTVAQLHDAGTRYLVVTHSWLAADDHATALDAWGYHRRFDGRDRSVFTRP